MNQKKFLKKQVSLPLWFVAASYSFLILSWLKEQNELEQEQTRMRTQLGLTKKERLRALKSEEKNRDLADSLIAYETVLADKNLLDLV
jgi:hypothetical protein